MNTLFDALRNNTSRHFAYCSNFSSSLRACKYTTQLAKYPHVSYVKLWNKVYVKHLTKTEDLFVLPNINQPYRTSLSFIIINY